jgi:hypothetical protein
MLKGGPGFKITSSNDNDLMCQYRKLLCLRAELASRRASDQASEFNSAIRLCYFY